MATTEQKLKAFLMTHPKLWDPSLEVPYIQLPKGFKVGELEVEAIYKGPDHIFRVFYTYLPTGYSYSAALNIASHSIQKQLLYHLNKMNS